MDDSDIREMPRRKAGLQRAGRIAIGLFFFCVGAFIAAAAIIGFDESHAGWQDYLILALPVPWLVVSGIVFAYRPKPKMRVAAASPSNLSIFHLAIVTPIFGGFLALFSAPDWSGVIRSLIVTVSAVAILLLLSHIFKKTSQKRSAADDHTVQ